MTDLVCVALLAAATAILCGGCERHPGQAPAESDIQDILAQIAGPALKREGPRVANVLVSPDGRFVLYDYWLKEPGEGQWGLVDVDGNPLVESLEGSSIWLIPDWSPDSSSIAYASWPEDHARLVIRHLADGVEDVILETEPNSPILDVAWCPTGGSIAFTRGWRSGCDLCLVDLASSQSRLLVDGAGTGIVMPQWDPHGEWIYFLRDLPGALYRVKAHTADPEAETVGDFRDVLGLWVSPDGHVLLARGTGEVGDGRTYCLVTPDRTPNSRTLAPLTDARSVTFSPDGKSLMFGMADTAAPEPDKAVDVFRASVDEPLEPQPVVSGTTGLARAGAWTRDGKVVFTRDHQSIWVADADGSNQRELVSLARHEPADASTR